ncbi:MAG TPA: histone-like nucleoid-structuring protein Lsr2, partial [Microlunatus sp.]|nr:histone-like nucleoid-structuring protein Lsr2 [Microlunatus sp.]
SLAQEWVYRWLGACRREHDLELATHRVEDTFAAGDPLPDPGPAHGPAPRRPKGEETEIRRWARSQGLAVSERGRVSTAVRRAWQLRDSANTT